MKNPYKEINVDKLMKENEELKKENQKLKGEDNGLEDIIKDDENIGYDFLEFLSKKSGWKHSSISGFSLDGPKNTVGVIYISPSSINLNPYYIVQCDNIEVLKINSNDAKMKDFIKSIKEIADKNKKNNSNDLMKNIISNW
jgi:hypothetical protein